MADARLDEIRAWITTGRYPAVLAEELLRYVDALEVERDQLQERARAFIEHHDNGQAGQPGHPKTYGEQDIWLAEWDRRYAALRALSAGTARGGVGDAE